GSLPPIVSQYEYDSNGNLVGTIDPLGRHTIQVFDSLDRHRLTEYPDHSQAAFDYDADANLIATRDCNGLIRTYTIDPLGRTKRVDVDRSGLPVGLIVEGSDFEAYEYDAMNRRRRDENSFA